MVEREGEYSLLFSHIVRLHAENRGYHDLSEGTIQAAGLELERYAGVIRVGASVSPRADAAVAHTLAAELISGVGDQLKETRTLASQHWNATYMQDATIERLETLMNEVAAGLVK